MCVCACVLPLLFYIYNTQQLLFSSLTQAKKIDILYFLIVLSTFLNFFLHAFFIVYSNTLNFQHILYLFFLEYLYPL